MNSLGINNCENENCAEGNLCQRCSTFYHFPSNNPNPVILYNDVLDLIYANESALNTEFLQKRSSYAKRFTHELTNSFKSTINSVSGKGHFHISTASNQYRFNIIYSNTQSVLYVYGVDITRELSLAHELEKEQDFLTRVLDNIPVDIAMFNKKQQYTYLNKVAVKDDGLRNWLINKTDFDYCDYKGLDKKLAESRQRYFNRALKKMEDVDYVDEIKNNGNTKYVLRRYHPVVKDKKVNEVIGYAVDITEQIETRNKLDTTHDLLFSSQITLKQFLSMYVHDVKHPMSNIEGLIEEFNRDDFTDPANAFIIDGLIESYKQLKKNLQGLTTKLDSSFNLFQTEKQELNIKSTLLEHAALAMQNMPARYKFRFILNSNYKVVFYGFMFNRIIKCFFEFLVSITKKSVLNITVFQNAGQHYNTIEISISAIHISKAQVASITNEVKAVNSVSYQSSNNPIADIACILSCAGGHLDFTFINDKMTFSLNFPQIDNSNA